MQESSCQALALQVLRRSWGRHITCSSSPSSALHISPPGDIEYPFLLNAGKNIRLSTRLGHFNAIVCIPSVATPDQDLAYRHLIPRLFYGV